MASSARIEELEKKFNENPRRYFAPLANEYRKAGEIEQAIALCRAYLPQQPGHMSGHIVFGQSLFDAGQHDEAQGVFETALTLDPENLIALRHLGDIAHSRGDVAGARVWYQRVLDADPRNEEIAEQLASLEAAPAPTAAGAAPETAAPAQGEQVSWGDINPEKPAAGAQPADAAQSAEAADALVIEHVSAGADNFAASTPEAEPATALAPGQAIPAEPAQASDPTIAEASASPEAAAQAGGPASAVSGVEASEAIEAAALTDDVSTAEIDLDALFDAAATDAPAGPRPSVEAAAAEPAAATPAPDKGAAVTAAPEPAGAASTAARGAIEPPASTTPEEPVAAPGASELDLEPAEFVPPPAENGPVAPAMGFETGHESVVGGPIRDQERESSAGRAGSRPAAFVTETMAELYLQQGFMQEALDVYRQLLDMEPDDAGLRERVAQLEQGARSSVSMAQVSDEVVDAARRRHAAPPRRSMRAFLGALATRRPPQRTSGEQQAIPPDAGSAEAGIMELTESEPDPEPEPAPVPPPRAVEEHRTPSPRPSTPTEIEGSLDSLFAGSAPTEADQAAAASLAGAFDASTVKSAPPISGRPARTAPTELSLDHVFRESGGDAGLQRPRSDFSFDQFFSDDADASGQGAVATEAEEEPPPRGEGEDDIGQFNDWLEGLKKK